MNSLAVFAMALVLSQVTAYRYIGGYGGYGWPGRPMGDYRITYPMCPFLVTYLPFSNNPVPQPRSYVPYPGGQQQSNLPPTQQIPVQPGLQPTAPQAPNVTQSNFSAYADVQQDRPDTETTIVNEMDDYGR